MCSFRNPTDKKDLPPNITDSKLFISKTSNKFFLKDKIYQISCLKKPYDLGVFYLQRNRQIVI